MQINLQPKHTQNSPMCAALLNLIYKRKTHYFLFGQARTHNTIQLLEGLSLIHIKNKIYRTIESSFLLEPNAINLCSFKTPLFPASAA
jgi:hypothetical protein